MKTAMRKELKIGILLFAIFNLINFWSKNVISELPALHFIVGGLTGLALCQIIIGILPESTYLKLKHFKRNS
jgi:hypothetical protein